MKKVGVLTFFRPINNGAVLQACALSKIVLPGLGYEGELIDYRLERIEVDRAIFGIKRIRREKGIFRKMRRVIADFVRFPINCSEKKLFDTFINRFLPVGSDAFFSSGDLKKKCQKYDAYIVGSDLVWSPTMTDGLDPVYFLTFVRNGKLKIAYAPSIGTTDLSEKNIKDFRRLLSKMDAVSVREVSSAIQLEKLTGYEVRNVLDPTLLTVADDWKEFYPQSKLEEDKYIFVFALESSPILVDTVNKLAKERNVQLIVYGRRNRLYKAKKVIFTDGKCGPSEFLNYIKNADKVVTNSFHGCAFSIIFHRDFYCIPHTTRGVRMVDLLNELDLSARIITDSGYLPKEKIDYDHVERKRSTLRVNSLNYLRSSLEKKII